MMRISAAPTAQQHSSTCSGVSMLRSPKTSVSFRHEQRGKLRTYVALAPIAVAGISGGRRIRLTCRTGCCRTSCRSALKAASNQSEVTTPLMDAARSFERSTGKQLTNVFLDGNFAPVAEEVTCEDLKVEGSLPEDFPDGVFIRNGPNPRFSPDNVDAPILGRTAHHWFEGDGMLHAVRFEKGRCSYRNRYIRTPDFEREEAAGKSLYRGIVDTTSAASLVNPFLNIAALGSAVKDVANTSVLFHGGRLLALVEGETMPAEIGLDDLSYKGHYNFGQKEKLPSFTAHPKVDPATGEMVFTAYSAFDEPPVHVGVVSRDGLLQHSSTVKSATRKTLMHDCAITEKLTLILDFPLTIDAGRTFSGGRMIDFEEQPSRIGVMQRYGSDVDQWFSFAPGYGFHMFNAYEDGDEVVLHGCRADTMMLSPPWQEDGTIDRAGFMGEYFREGSPKTTRLHEWRMNMTNGSCSERDLGPPDFIDFPTVSPKVVGRRQRYGYCAVFSRIPSLEAGVGVSGSLRKIEFPTDAGMQPRIQEHTYGHGISGQEGIFVPRPGSEEEDDGWVLVCTYEEGKGSQLRIIDAQNFAAAPVCCITLPQRVPYGFHGTFVAL